MSTSVLWKPEYLNLRSPERGHSTMNRSLLSSEWNCSTKLWTVCSMLSLAMSRRSRRYSGVCCNIDVLVQCPSASHCSLIAHGLLLITIDSPIFISSEGLVSFRSLMPILFTRIRRQKSAVVMLHSDDAMWLTDVGFSPGAMFDITDSMNSVPRCR